MGRRLKIVPGESPDYPAFMLATIEALKALGNKASKQEIDKKICEIELLTKRELAIEKRNKNGTEPFFNYHSAWARTILRHNKAVDTNGRGIWELTEFGKSITSLSQTKALNQKYRKDKGII